MDILYIGQDGTHTTSRHRADALRRLGHAVEVVDFTRALPRHALLRHLNYRTGYRFFTDRVLDYLKTQVTRPRYDAVWVNGGYAISGRVVRWLRGLGGKVVTYINDDPTGWRDRSNWSSFRASIPEYDLCVVVRDVSAEEFAAAGARRCLRVHMGYDEVAHAPLPFSREDEARWKSDVVFVGTWMPERGPFLAHLVQAGVPLAIYGERWDRCKEWPTIRPAWRGDALRGAEYVKAIEYATVALGLLSKGNRDGHTTRSAEIPYIGSVLCAERSAEHQEMFREGKAALFWSSAEECVEQCKRLLSAPDFCATLRAGGHAQVLELGLGNETVCRRVLTELEK